MAETASLFSAAAATHETLMGRTLARPRAEHQAGRLGVTATAGLAARAQASARPGGAGRLRALARLPLPQRAEGRPLD
jgi:hypothetical protein